MCIDVFWNNIHIFVTLFFSKGNQLGDAFAYQLSEALTHSHGLLGSLSLSECGFGEDSGKILGPALGNEILLGQTIMAKSHSIVDEKSLKKNNDLNTLKGYISN